MRNLDLSVPRGVDDIDPERFARQARVKSAFEEVARLYNFKLMEPASLEHLAILRAKGGEGVDREVYAFKDKGGRDVGLRFDMTVGITRYVSSRRDLKLPAKLAALGAIWRYDEPQYGRYRWSHQWDLEIFGPPSLDADAEVIDAGAAILRRIGLSDATIRVGDRRVVEEFIRRDLKVIEDGRVIELMRALDKVEKRPTGELKAEYASKGFQDDKVARLLEFGTLRGEPDEVLSRMAESHLESARDLAALADLLESRDLKNVEYNMSIVRGLDYYTGVVFEAADNNNRRLGSLFGGGRYDALPKLFGRPELSATGAAGGIERMALSLGPASETPTRLTYVAVPGPSTVKDALRVGRYMRGRGVPCEVPLLLKPLSKQLEDASGMGAEWVVIVGEREARAKEVTLRDMKSRAEELLPLEAALERILHA